MVFIFSRTVKAFLPLFDDGGFPEMVISDSSYVDDKSIAC